MTARSTFATPGRKLRVAAVQTVSGVELAANLRAVEKLVERAAGEGAGLVALPEFFALMAVDERAKLAVCEPAGNGPLQSFLAELASRHRLWLVGGTIPLRGRADGKVRNSTLVFDPRGECVARYDKIHLFSFSREGEQYDESTTIEAGDEVCAFDSPLGRIGLAVCYDLRFPELFRAMGGAELIVLPAAFTYTTGQAHWEILLRARAIENQCFLIAPGQGGEHQNGRRTWGHSMVIDPWGEVLACQVHGEGLAIAELDFARLDSIRASLPALHHRRLR
ncbi:MAG: carbon-nitrogen hydrolase family protein [Thauera sp.]|jgi:nitrilase|nr:carbon-nitrogen hydrolase family protein [Thauera sp.]